MKLLLMFFCSVISLASVAFSASGDSVLLWMIGTDNKVEGIGGGPGVTVGSLNVDGRQANAARVRVFQNGQAVTVEGEGVALNLYSELEDGTWSLGVMTDEGLLTSSILSFEDAPTYRPPGAGEDVSYIGPSWADFGEYADPSYSFAVEYGNLTDNGDWLSLAYSEMVGYATLSRFYTSDSVAEPPYGPWSPGGPIPEPTSGFIMLVGGAILALRRRKDVRAGF